MKSSDEPPLLKFLGYLFSSIIVWLVGALILWCVLLLSQSFQISRLISFFVLGTSLSWILYIFLLASGRLARNAPMAGGILRASLLYLVVCPLFMTVALFGISLCGAFVLAVIAYMVDLTGEAYNSVLVLS